MSTGVQPAELGFFVVLANSGSLSSAGRELGISTAAVSKRLAYIEARLGLSLVNRTTRRMSLTPEGEVLYEHARRILGEIDDLDQLLSKSKGAPQGLLRVNATLGFGRIHVAPVISRYAALHPQVDVQLQLSAHPPPMSEDAFDVCVRFGDRPDSRVIARRAGAEPAPAVCLSQVHRGACAPPARRASSPRTTASASARATTRMACWRLTSGRGARQRTEAVKIRGNLTTNDGEIAVSWALEGHGILMRAEWDIKKHLASGRLVAGPGAVPDPRGEHLRRLCATVISCR
jgi:DNA-binding transcriptional LysR family regulator